METGAHPLLLSLFCRSLLASDSERAHMDDTLHRLPFGRLWALSMSNGQAGAYIPNKPEQAPWYS